MYRCRALTTLVLLSLFMLSLWTSSAWGSTPEWMQRVGTIAHSKSLQDGAHIYLDAVEIGKIKAKQEPAYFVIYECFSSQDKLIVLTQPSPNLRMGMTIDVEGTLATLPSGDRAIINSTVYGYTDESGNLLYHGPLIKGLLEPAAWQWKTNLTVTSTNPTSLPSVTPNTVPAETPIYYPRIGSDTVTSRVQTQHIQSQRMRTQDYYEEISGLYALSDGSLVELQCKGITATGTQTIGGTTYNYLDLIENPPATDTIRAYYSSAVTQTDRVNKITGQIRHVGTTPVIDIDTGPGGFDPQILVGTLQTVAEGSIVWAKTFADLSTLPSSLSGKVVTRTFPSLGYFYIEETSRSSGIRVYDSGMASSVAIGDIVDVSGDMSTDDGERVIIASSTTITGYTTILSQGMNNRSLAGGNFNVLTPGAYDASGLNNVGLLIRTWGKVTAVGSDYFYFNDGSNCDDSSGSSGVRVVGISGYMPSVNDYVAVTGISGLATYATNLARTVRLALSSDLSGTCPPLPPTNMTAVSTGSGKITLYWDYVSGATGYNIYRGTTSGGENYNAPVNGGTPVNTPTYSGSSVYTFTDTGLTNGTEYFYTVKAVAECGESQASNEDSDIPDVNGIPWDSSNPSDVLSAVRAQYSNDSPQGSLRVAGPDGRIYEDGQSTVLPPDGTWIPGTNKVQMTDGSTISLPDFPDSSGGFTILATTLPQHLGPYRRLRTTASYTGVRGNLYVPTAGNVFVNRNATYSDGQSTTDDIYILLGSTGTGEVDAGLQWSQVGTTKNGWNPFMLSYPRQRPIINNPASPRFTFDQYVNLKYRPRTTYPGIKRSVALLTIDSVDQGVTRSYGVYSVYKANETVRVKRMHSIAQARLGAFHSSSYIQGVSWNSGQVRTSGGSWTNWTSGITNENGSNPTKGSIVNWFETSPYVAEDNIKIDLR